MLKAGVVVVPDVVAVTEASSPAFPVVVVAEIVGVTPSAPGGIVKLKLTPVAGLPYSSHLRQQ